MQQYLPVCAGCQNEVWTRGRVSNTGSVYPLFAFLPLPCHKFFYPPHRPPPPPSPIFRQIESVQKPQEQSQTWIFITKNHKYEFICLMSFFIVRNFSLFACFIGVFQLETSTEQRNHRSFKKQTFSSLIFIFSGHSTLTCASARDNICYNFVGLPQKLLCECRSNEYFNGYRCLKGTNPCTPGVDCPICRKHDALNEWCSCPFGRTLANSTCGEDSFLHQTEGQWRCFQPFNFALEIFLCSGQCKEAQLKVWFTPGLAILLRGSRYPNFMTDVVVMYSQVEVPRFLTGRTKLWSRQGVACLNHSFTKAFSSLTLSVTEYKGK